MINPIDMPSNEQFSRVWDRLEHLGFSVHHGNPDCILPPLCEVPGGPFIMGSDKQQDSNAYDDELPQVEHHTALFTIAKYPVTVAEYAIAMGIGIVTPPERYRGLAWSDQLARLDSPVTSVSWFDAIAYCRWLSEVSGMAWRLPTEAEWEKATRGNDGRVFPWGNRWEPNLANTPDGGPGHLLPIGWYPEAASPFGMEDAVGNAWEWCRSLYWPYPYRADDGREDSQAIGNRVMHGSAWYCIPANARAACRGIGFEGRYLGRGFRLLRVVE